MTWPQPGRYADQGAAQLAAMEDVAPLLIARRAEYSPALAARVAARAGRSWNELEDDVCFVPDLTGGAWPAQCLARWRVQHRGHPVWSGYVCTRIGSHTGRHAAGSSGRIVAVWDGDRP